MKRCVPNFKIRYRSTSIERLKTELAGTVPISHYDQLLDRISGMVPRDLYVTSEKRVLELEDHSEAICSLYMRLTSSQTKCLS